MTKQTKAKFLLVLLTIVLIIGGVVNYNTKEEKKKELIIYKNDNGLPHDPYLLCCDTGEIYTKVKTDTYDARVLNVSEKGNYILIEDGVLKILNTKTNELQKIDLEPNYERYYLQTIDNEKLLGITYLKDEEYYKTNQAGYYNLNTKRKLYEDEYSIIKAENEYYLTAFNKDEEKYILSSLEEKVLPVNSNLINNKDNEINTNILTYNEKIILSRYIEDNKTYTIHNIHYNYIIENISLLSVNEDKIYIIKDNNLIIYDFDLREISRTDISNYSIDYLINNYGVYIKEDKLYLLNLNSLESKEVYNLEETYTYANTYQGYKTTGLHELTKNKEGIYLYLTKKANIKENENDTLDIEIFISKDLTINIFELDGSRMSELETGGLIS